MSVAQAYMSPSIILPDLDLWGEQLPDRFYKQKLSRSLRGAIARAEKRQQTRAAEGKPRVEVSITHREVMQIAEAQNCLCALTRLRFWMLKDSGSYNPTIPSLDRIRHNGPYSRENVRIVMLGVNSLRGTGSDEHMYLMAEALLANRRSP